MIEKDFFSHYFDTERSHYDIFKLFIKLKYYEFEKDDPLKRVEYIAETVHEYIHYLQSFTTIYGIQTILILFSILNDFLFSLNTDSIKFPFQKENVIIKQMHERMKLLYDMQYFAITSNHLEIENEKYFKNYKLMNGKQVKVYFFKNHYNSQLIPLTPKVIRENMAMMAYCITRGIGAEAFLESTKGEIHSEYWIIFEYLMYNAPNSLNTLVITFYLCELALMSSEPTIMIEKFISQFIDFNRSTDVHFSDENSLFNAFAREYDIFASSKKWINKLLIVTQNQKNMFDKHAFENEYFQFLSTFLQIIINALEYRKKFSTIFIKGLGSLWIDNMTQKFGSPVVSYRDPKIFLLGKSYITTDPYIYIFALLYFMQNLESINLLYNCPFYKKFPVCNEEKIIDICENHALDVKKDENDAGCALYNVLQLMGLKNN